MKSPQTVNELMRHLRDYENINISGSLQKQELICIGYYHGYKGYRFYNNYHNRIPYSDFDQLMAVIEYDNCLKAFLYPQLMFLETVIKNIVCNVSAVGLKGNTFEDVYSKRMQDNPSDTRLQMNRLKLRNTIYTRISSRYREEQNKDNQMIRHFYNRGEDVPVWCVFEIMYMSDLSNFFNCLNMTIREKILQEMNMLDVSVDTNRNLLSEILYTLKALRNAVAHNQVIYDTRFKDRRISPVVRKWVEKESGIRNITLYSLIDYIIIICCLLKKTDFNSKRVRNLITAYRSQNQILKASLPSDLYRIIIPYHVEKKVERMDTFK